MSLIKKCCGIYTFRKECSKCGSETNSAHYEFSLKGEQKKK